ncbi:MAG: hypothetical protein ACON46_07200 [Coraliomargaritaceae bacterium]
MSDDCVTPLKRRLKQQLSGQPNLLASVLESFPEEVLLKEFLFAVDESVFGLVDWVEAQCVLADWLEERGLVLPVGDRINYLSCVAEAGSGGLALENLSSMIEEMLATYGCERATKKP